MLILRKYQLDIIFLFFSLILLVWLSFFMLEYYGRDPHNYEWFVVGPILLFYLSYLYRVRTRIQLADRRKMTARTLFYWIILGIMLFGSYSTPIPAADYWSINIFFITFTLLLADSYWDFRRLSLKSFRDRREIK